MAAPCPDAADPVLQRLRAVAREAPELQEAAMVYGAIIPIMRDTEIDLKPIGLTREQALDVLQQGRPMLSVVEVELDGTAVGDLLMSLAAAVEACGAAAGQNGYPETAAAAGGISLAMKDGRLDMLGLLPSMASGDAGPVRDAAEDAQVDPGLLWLLAQTSLMPVLHAARRQLEPLAEGVAWEKGACPVCGARATFGELRGNSLAKHLRCVRCGADWRSRRLQCHHCGNEDHLTLSFLYPEGQGEMKRVEVCGKCKGYLKVITAFAPTPPEMLPVEDLATAPLDAMARDRGFSRLGRGSAG